MKRHQTNMKNNQIDFQLQNQLKKQNNYCNKLIKNEVREKNGKNITNVNNVKQIWSCINDILKPENSGKNSMKIETENQMIEDPLELAELFNNFLKEKVEKLAAKI